MAFRKTLILIILSSLIISLIIFLWHTAISDIFLLNRSFIPSIPIITIESDDWGALKGIDFGTDPKGWSNWSQMDCLETTEDVKNLSALLLRHHDSRGRPSVITANVVFKTIRADLAKKEIIRRSVPVNVVSSWKEALKAHVFYPQLHAMRESDEYSLLSPDPSVRSKTSPYMIWDGHRFIDLPVKRVEKVVLEGQDLFYRTFGFASLSTIPPRGLWGEATDRAYAKAGIRYVQGWQQVQNRNGWQKPIVGERTQNGIKLLAPRISFEPAFAWKKGESVDDFVRKKSHKILRILSSSTPVAISTHRINYVTGHSHSQAEYGLGSLDRLLTNLLLNRPDIIFLTSPELGQLLEKGYFIDVFTKEKVNIPNYSLWQLILFRWNDAGTFTKLLTAALCAALLIIWLLVILLRKHKKYFPI